jgi:hypothetical protein
MLCGGSTLPFPGESRPDIMNMGSWVGREMKIQGYQAVCWYVALSAAFEDQGTT